MENFASEQELNTQNNLESELSEEMLEQNSSTTEAATEINNQTQAVSTQEVETTVPVGNNLAEIQNLREEIEALKGELENSNNERDSLKNQLVRNIADFDNFRKRTQKEKEDLEQQIKSDTIKKILPVVDDFERARSLIKPQTEGETTIHKSYQSVYKQLVDNLKRLGVSPMRPEGKEFDPNWHEAVMRQPTDEHPEGTVIEELVRGYFLGERVLRHAMVKVASPPEPSETTDQGQADIAES